MSTIRWALLAALIVSIPGPTSAAERSATALVAGGVSDGQGGVIVAWDESRGGNQNLYAQRLDANGARLWGENGIPVCEAAGDQQRAVLTADGAGGAIIAWDDARAGIYSVYAQRVNALGVRQWATDGVAAVISETTAFAPQIAADDAGGAFIAWLDLRDPANDVYAQHLSANGQRLWMDAGVGVAAYAASQFPSGIIPDGRGGAIVSWTDTRNGGVNNWVQRIDASGTKLWAPDGVYVFGLSFEQVAPLVPDGAGGALLATTDAASVRPDVYAQRIDATGVRRWTTGPLVSGPGGRRLRAVAGDGAGGLILAWSNIDVFNNYSLVAQRVDSTRASLWGLGVQVRGATLGNSGTYPFDDVRLVGDGAGGVVASWVDYRQGTQNSDLYSQHITRMGSVGWTTYGVSVCAAPGRQIEPRIVAAPGGEAVVIWKDFRLGTTMDSSYYAQRLRTDGTPAWTVEGTPIDSPPEGMIHPAAAARSGGGAFVTWEEARNGALRVFARAHDANGVPAGPTIAVCDAPGRQADPRIVSDDTGGAIVTWRDFRADAVADLYAQRLAADGTRLWGADGAPVCVAAGSQDRVSVAPDGVSGLLVAWEDQRASSVRWNAYSQHLDAGGAPVWAVDGVPYLATLAWSAFTPAIASDGAGGAVVCVRNNDAAGYEHLYARRLTTTGATAWTELLTSVVGLMRAPTVVADGAGGAFVGWTSSYPSPGNLFVAQHLDGAGSRGWGVDGITLTTNAGNSFTPQIVRDSGSGAIIAWTDDRAGYLTSDVYAQRFGVAGAPQWGAGGVLVCGATAMQTQPVMRGDGAGGAVLGWIDFRVDGAAGNAFAQRVTAAGIAQWTPNGVALSSGARVAALGLAADGGGGAIVAYQDRPETRGAQVIVRHVDGAGASPSGTPVTGAPGRAPGFSLAVLAGGATPRLAYRVAPGSAGRLTLFDLGGRRLAERTLGAGSSGEIALEELARVPAGLYFVRVTQAGAMLARRVSITP